MNRSYFKKLETHDNNLPLELTTVIDQLAFNEKGLIPVITQDAISKNVLMFAWMSKESLYLTIQTKHMTYWSRSRNCLWVKGKSSGHTQSLTSMAFDCDGDVILCQVEQVGAACHTGRRDCFYLNVDLDKSKVTVTGQATL